MARRFLANLMNTAFLINDSIFYPNLMKELNGLSPNFPKLTLSRSCKEVKTIFDQATSYSCNCQHEKIPPEALGQQDVSAATSSFMRCLVDSEQLKVDIPLSAVEAISCSSSYPTEFPTVYTFGEHCYNQCRQKKLHLSEREYFEKCLNESLLDGKTNFDIKLWEPSLRWSNSGGSHRFSTAFFINAEERYEHIVSGHLTVYTLDYSWLNKLCSVFDAYLMTVKFSEKSSIYKIFEINKIGSSSTFVTLSTDPFTESITILLLLSKKQSISGIAKRWIKNTIRQNCLLALPETIEQLRHTEHQAKKMLRQKEQGGTLFSNPIVG